MFIVIYISHEFNASIQPQICISCLQMRNVHYVSAFLSFDWSVCMYPGCTESRKSQMSILSSNEPLTIWKSSNCRPYTASECSCGKSERNHQSWPLLKLTSQNPIHTVPDCTLIQGHRSRCSRCSCHWIIIILGLVLSCWTLHIVSQIIPEMITTGVKF